jgi:ferrous iron transport protein A
MHGFMRRFGHGFGHRFQPEGKQLTLAQMATGQSGVVVEILGGHGLVNRLDALGIRPSKRITKVGSMFMRGPVTVEVDRARVAVGFGMASKIIIELD